MTFSNIELRFLPPNTTSVLQPLDQGIIRALKAGYRKRLVETLLQNLRVGREHNIDLLGALSMPGRSWAVVTKESIQNCFRHVGFRMPGDDSPNSDDSTEDTAGVSAEVWTELAEFPGATDGSTFGEFVSADDDVTIMGQLQDEDYVADVVPTTSESGDSNEEINGGPLPTSSEVISALALVQRYCANMEGCGLSCSDSLDNVEACVLSQAAKSLKQKKIQDYFVPK